MKPFTYQSFMYYTILLAGWAFLTCVSCRKPPDVVKPGEGLKDTFRDKFLIGVALNKGQILGRDTLALPFVIRHFNSITAENEMKWERIHPMPDVYDFTVADSMVAFGKRNNMFIVGHALVWHSQVPDWVFTDERGKSLTRDALLQRMKSHIDAVVGRYKGKVDGWDVVNEALEEDGQLRKSKWYEIIGEDYIQKAFEYAREADPGAELYYNDYNIENKEKREGAIRLIKDLQQKGIIVNGVGIQGHWHLDSPDIQEIDSSLLAYGKLGLKVMITELDVNVIPEPSGIVGADVAQRADYQRELNPWPESFPDSMQQVLADRYAGLFALFLKHSDKVSRVTFWGLNDGYSWKNNWPIPGRTTYPLLFDRNYQPKPAYNAVVELARKQTGTNQ